MKIEVHLFNSEIEEHVVKASAFYIGRSAQCEVVINHESMSRKHCYVEFDNGQLYVTDLGSTNGISIDGTRISPNKRTYYIASLPLMIGAATIKIDASEHQPEEIPKVKPVEHSKTTAGQKTLTLQKIPKTENSRPKPRPTARKVAGTPGKEKKKVNKRELWFALISLTLFVAMAAWYFNQN